MELHEKKKLVRRQFEELINRRNFGILETDFSPEYVDHNPAPGMQPGALGLREWLERIFTGCPDLSVSIDDVIAEGDRVVVRNTWRGTHSGPLFGLEATGKSFEFAGIAIFRVGGGCVCERWSIVDLMSLRQQLA